jgi:hypothetical protein
MAVSALRPDLGAPVGTVFTKGKYFGPEISLMRIAVQVRHMAGTQMPPLNAGGLSRSHAAGSGCCATFHRAAAKRQFSIFGLGLRRPFAASAAHHGNFSLVMIAYSPCPAVMHAGDSLLQDSPLE